MRLDLGSGRKPMPGFEGVDIAVPGTWQVDLFAFPWPWADSSCEALHAAHFIEHIPAQNTPDGKDMLFAFFDEAWRISQPNAPFYLRWPAHDSMHAFVDPTHRRFIPLETLRYLSAPGREEALIGHYNAVCDFKIEEAFRNAADENIAILRAVK